jgi:two-component system, OmpR family, response regulator BaeR
MTALAKTILIVEDESKIAAILRDYLHAEGYLTLHLDNGNRVIDSVRKNMPDVILLDLMLPGKDGLTLCRELRAFSKVPIIMLTARVEEIDRLLGLELGADDYVCKPFSSREVVARVKALLRRVGLAASNDSTVDGTAKRQAPITLDGECFSACVAGVMLELTPVEFRLLQTLAAQVGRVFSRNQLMDLLYVDHRIVSDRTVDSHVKNLRRKIVEAGGEEDWLRSIYGMGYKLEW